MMEWWQYKRMWEYYAEKQAISGCKTGLLYKDISKGGMKIERE